MEEAELQATIELRASSHVQTFEQYAIAQLIDRTLSILCQCHTILSRGNGEGIAGIAIVADAQRTCEGEIQAQLDSSSCLYTHMAAIDATQRLIHEGTCLIVVISIELGAIPYLCEESCHTTTHQRIVERIGQVTTYHLLACTIVFFEP